MKREAEQALNANDRAQALRWLAASYYVMEDEPSAWHYLQQAVAQEPSLGGYLHHAALRLAGKFALNHAGCITRFAIMRSLCILPRQWFYRATVC